MTAISVSNLCKNYVNNHVLKGISFSVDEGEIFAVLGTNGAGKSTVINEKFDGESFETLVQRIVIKDRNTIEVEFKCGLKEIENL